MPDGMQRLLNSAAWNADGVRDDVRGYVVRHLGDAGGVLVVGETGFVKKGTRSATAGSGLLEHPGPALARWKKAVAKGEQVYKKWGRAAVFLTPSMVSGALEMPFRQFVVWNLLAGAAFVLSLGPASYSVAGHLPVTTTQAAACVVLISHYYRRHKGRSSGPGTAAKQTDRAINQNP